jgi:hypothetical protein
MKSPVYDVLLVAHVLAAVIGFGALAATGSFAANARRADDPRASATLRSYFRPGRNWAGRVLYLLPLLGVALLAVGDHEGVGEAWPWIGLALWLVAAGIATGRLWPAEREIQHLLGEAAPAASGGRPSPMAGARGAEPALAGACRRAERAAALTSLCFVAALAVMIVQPH